MSRDLAAHRVHRDLAAHRVHRDLAAHRVHRDLDGHRVRPTLVVTAVGALVATIIAASVVGVAGWWVALGLLAPDLVPLVRMSRPVEPGRMPASMVGLYNATHALPGPLLLAGAGIVFSSADVTITAAAWLVHIVADRSVGYTLRDRDGSLRPSRAAASTRLHAGAGIPRR